MRWPALALGLCLSLCAGLHRAAARPFTVDDLLKQESFGSVVLDPTGRYAVVERRGRYDSAASFDGQSRNPLGSSRLLLADLTAVPAPHPLMAQPSGYGYLAGPWAPGSRHIAVFRLAHGGWELGVSTPSTGDIRWLGLTPASNLRGRNVVWKSAQTLLVLARPAEDPPRELRRGSQSARRLPPRWAAAAAGKAAATVVGSGAYLQAAPKPAPTLLVEFDLQQGTRRTLATGAFTDMELAPGGQHLALLETAERLQPSAGRPPQGEWGTATEAARLAILDFATSSIVRPCTKCDLLNSLLSWSPSGRKLLVFARAVHTPWTAGAFHIYSTGSGRLEPLDRGALIPALRYRPERLQTGWLGEQVLVQARAAGQPEGRIDWWLLFRDGARNLTAKVPAAPTAIVTSAQGLRVLAGDRLWNVSLEGTARKVGIGRVTRIALPYVIPERRLSYVASRKPESLLLRTEAGRLRMADGRELATRVAAGDVVAAYSRAAEGLLALQASPTGDAVLDLLRPDQVPVRISEINQDLQDTDAPQVVPIRHAGPQGQSLTSWLYLPPETVGGSPPPLVIWPYLGDNHPTAPAPKPPILNFAVNTRIIVGKGYAVLIPSLPLPMSAGEPLSGIANRILGIVDATAAQAPGAFDPGRLALWGHSYGGYTTLGAISQSDRFSAAIAMAAPSDLISHYGNFQLTQRVSPEDGVWPAWQAGYAENIQGRMGAPPWGDPDRYVRNSPIFHVETIHTPVLLIHGDQDDIGLSQSEEMFSALFRLKRDAMLVTYWGEGHIISSPGNVRDLYARAFRWLERYLAPGAGAGQRRSSFARPELKQRFQLRTRGATLRLGVPIGTISS